MQEIQMSDGCDNYYNIVDKRLIKLQHINAYGVACRFLKCLGTSRGHVMFLPDDPSRFYPTFPYIPYYTSKVHRYGNYGYLHSSKNHFSVTETDDGQGDLVMALTPGDDEAEFSEFWVYEQRRCPSWDYYGELFLKNDPPMTYCAKNNTVYKLSMHSNQQPCLQLFDVLGKKLKYKSGLSIGGAFDIDGQGLLPSNIGATERELRGRCHQDIYLAVTEGFGKDDPTLYLVIRHHNREVLGFAQTRAVDVFRFDFKEKSVTYTTKLDNHAFFIGSGSEAFAVSVTDCPGLSPDSIYIADDLGVYNLEHKCLTPLFDMGDLSMTRPQTFWVAPPSIKQLKFIATQLIIEDIETTPVSIYNEDLYNQGWAHFIGNSWTSNYLLEDDENSSTNEYYH